MGPQGPVGPQGPAGPEAVIGPSAITTIEILDGTIGADDIGAGAVTAAALADANNEFEFTVVAHAYFAGYNFPIEILEYTMPGYATTLQSVQVYVVRCLGTFSAFVDVLEAGVTVLDAQVEVTASDSHKLLTGVIADADIAAGAAIKVLVNIGSLPTTMEYVTVTLRFRAALL